MSEIVLKENEEDDLDFVRGIRKDLIKSIVKRGMPEDIKDRSILLTALADMDRTSLGKKKIKSDEGISNTQLMAAKIAADIFTNNDVKMLMIPKVPGTVQVLDVDIPDASLVFGELGIGSAKLNYDEFLSAEQVTGS